MTIPTTEIETLPPAAAVLAAMFLAVQAEGGPAQRASVQQLFDDALAGGLADERIRDTIGAALNEIAGIDIVVDDAGNTIGLAVVGFPPFAIAGAAYTAQLIDRYRYLRFTSGAAVTFTIPPEADVNFPIGSLLEFEQAGDGVVTVAAGAGVTLISRGNAFATAGKYASAQLKKVDANIWTVIGDVV
ncbi:MAG: hypothetical protein ACK4SJ_11195 [Sphingorhabdus sp.]